MKLITEPSVYLVGKQTLCQTELKRFMDDHNTAWWPEDDGAQALCETAGRLCYMSFDKPRPGGNKAYLDRILSSAHGSVAEHAVWNLILCGISRTCSHELVRHRAGVGYSQLSQRYVDESVAEYVVPLALREEVECGQMLRMYGNLCLSPEKMRTETNAAEAWPVAYRIYEDHIEGRFFQLASVGKLWLESVESAHDAYVVQVEHLTTKLSYVCSQCGSPTNLESLPPACAVCGGKALSGTELRKAARQAARSVLPNATETKVFVTANARALRHMIEMRCSRHAEPEIRVLFGKVWELLREDAPNLFGDYEKVSLMDGTFELRTEWRKV